MRRNAKVIYCQAFIQSGRAILDEPTSALDSESSKIVYDLLSNTCHDKLIIISSHDPYIIEIVHASSCL